MKVSPHKWINLKLEITIVVELFAGTRINLQVRLSVPRPRYSMKHQDKQCGPHSDFPDCRDWRIVKQ